MEELQRAGVGVVELEDCALAACFSESFLLATCCLLLSAFCLVSFNCDVAMVLFIAFFKLSSIYCIRHMTLACFVLTLPAGWDRCAAMHDAMMLRNLFN